MSRVRSREEREEAMGRSRASFSEGGKEGNPVGRRESSPLSSPSSSLAEKQREAGLMFLDRELYQVVKRLKEAKDQDVPLSEAQLLDLFFSVTHKPRGPEEKGAAEGGAEGGAEGRQGPHGGGGERSGRGGEAQEGKDRGREAGGEGDRHTRGGDPLAMEESFDGSSLPDPPVLPLDLPPSSSSPSSFPPSSRPASASPKSRELSLVLAKLQDVDQILEHLAVFWAQTEVILEVLLQKSEHVERFVAYSHKPRLKDRFLERLDEYRAFWVGVQGMCHQFTAAVSQNPSSSSSPSSPSSLHGPGGSSTLDSFSSAAKWGGGGGGRGGYGRRRAFFGHHFLRFLAPGLSLSLLRGEEGGEGRSERGGGGRGGGRPSCTTFGEPVGVKGEGLGSLAPG
ncbi:hypothetical protein NSK_008391 [Nannochloropsis salina CCMP1776]|uniref:Uncharacterized protein n=1 Tax=Nannochloropsis salina CCMP1776 TaxID=1027361 RepID=A0A4D9CUB5_9STRA|nr:hypothetical protein NSK_008391 [Nannochloropsis salina CCMP1776]|eukprot:TFJ80248.1 hypothetical protein NSK_008391 [Nannochloropsis salina CCMP1776]